MNGFAVTWAGGNMMCVCRDVVWCALTLQPRSGSIHRVSGGIMLAYGEGGVAPETIGRGRKKVTASRRFAITIFIHAKK
jgi:hypothetical protein